jgi:hypothetical protein
VEGRGEQKEALQGFAQGYVGMYKQYITMAHYKGIWSEIRKMATQASKPIQKH